MVQPQEGNTSSRAEQLRTLGSPARQEIVHAVAGHGPCSISEIADWLGRPADSLYYHVRLLLRAGLLEESGTRRAKRREEVLYETPRNLGMMSLASSDPQDAASRKEVVRSAGAMLRQTERNFRRAFDSNLAKPSGRDRNISAGRFKGWLSRAELAEVMEHMDRVRHILTHSQDRFDQNKDKNGEQPQLIAATVVVTPLSTGRDQHPDSAHRNTKNGSKA